jgi:heat shock protein HslJ
MSDATHPFAARVSLPDGRLLAGCCRIPATPLEGPTWRLTSTGDPASGASDARAPPVTARFEGGRVSGFSGCNRFTASYTRDGETLTVGSLAGTLMACPEPRMAIEKGFQDALAGTHRVAISGTRLTLTRASGSPLVFQAEPDPTLEGVVWNVTGFNNGRHAVVSPRVGTALTMTFDKGVVQGNGGCNAFRAPYTSQGNRLSIGAAVTTRKACQADGVMQQEREFLAALESSHLWTVENGLLDVHRADGERVLNAVATPRSPP